MITTIINDANITVSVNGRTTKSFLRKLSAVLKQVGGWSGDIKAIVYSAHMEHNEFTRSSIGQIFSEIKTVTKAIDEARTAKLNGQ